MQGRGADFQGVVPAAKQARGAHGGRTLFALPRLLSVAQARARIPRLTVATSGAAQELNVATSPSIPAAQRNLTIALAGLRHTFVVSDPAQPDCPIVFASDGRAPAAAAATAPRDPPSTAVCIQPGQHQPPTGERARPAPRVGSAVSVSAQLARAGSFATCPPPPPPQPLLPRGAGPRDLPAPRC